MRDCVTGTVALALLGVSRAIPAAVVSWVPVDIPSRTALVAMANPLIQENTQSVYGRGSPSMEMIGLHILPAVEN